MVSLYQEVLEQAKQACELTEEMNTEDLANFIVSSWHGALIKMKIVKNATPLENHKTLIIKLLTGK